MIQTPILKALGLHAETRGNQTNCLYKEAQQGFFRQRTITTMQKNYTETEQQAAHTRPSPNLDICMNRKVNVWTRLNTIPQVNSAETPWVQWSTKCFVSSCTKVSTKQLYLVSRLIWVHAWRSTIKYITSFIQLKQLRNPMQGIWLIVYAWQTNF